MHFDGDNMEYYTYEGSLMYPPCYQTVLYVILPAIQILDQNITEVVSIFKSFQQLISRAFIEVLPIIFIAWLAMETNNLLAFSSGYLDSQRYCMVNHV